MRRCGFGSTLPPLLHVTQFNYRRRSPSRRIIRSISLVWLYMSMIWNGERVYMEDEMWRRVRSVFEKYSQQIILAEIFQTSQPVFFSDFLYLISSSYDVAPRTLCASTARHSFRSGVGAQLNRLKAGIHPVARSVSKTKFWTRPNDESDETRQDSTPGVSS
jgi:hypothetical protein